MMQERFNDLEYISTIALFHLIIKWTFLHCKICLKAKLKQFTIKTNAHVSHFFFPNGRGKGNTAIHNSGLTLDSQMGGGRRKAMKAMKNILLIFT